MKRVIAIIMISAIVFTLLAGCNGMTGGIYPAMIKPLQTALKADTKSTAPTKTDITLWYYWETKLHQETLARIMKGFNDSQDEIVISAEYTPFADFKKQLSIGLAANKLPDIVIIDNPDHAAYAAMGMFADISGYIRDWPDKEQYFKGPWESCTLDGKVYGIPFGSNCLALYYNEDMLNSAGVDVPETWDQLGKQPNNRQWSSRHSYFGSQERRGTFQLIPWLLSAGASVEKVDSPEAIKAFSYLADLIKDGSMSKEVINWTQGDVMKQFIAGKVAMMINGPWQIPTMKKEAPDLKWGVSLIPKDKQFASVLGGENFGVINGDKIEESVKFLMYAVQKDLVNDYIDDFGYIPSRKDAAAAPQFTEDPIMKVFAEEMNYAMPRGPHPQWPELSNAISTALQETLTLTKSPEDAARGRPGKNRRDNQQLI